MTAPRSRSRNLTGAVFLAVVAVVAAYVAYGWFDTECVRRELAHRVRVRPNQVVTKPLAFLDAGSHRRFVVQDEKGDRLAIYILRGQRPYAVAVPMDSACQRYYVPGELEPQKAEEVARAAVRDLIGRPAAEVFPARAIGSGKDGLYKVTVTLFPDSQEWEVTMTVDGRLLTLVCAQAP